MTPIFIIGSGNSVKFATFSLDATTVAAGERKELGINVTSLNATAICAVTGYSSMPTVLCYTPGFGTSYIYIELYNFTSTPITCEPVVHVLYK